MEEDARTLQAFNGWLKLDRIKYTTARRRDTRGRGKINLDLKRLMQFLCRHGGLRQLNANTNQVN